MSALAEFIAASVARGTAVTEPYRHVRLDGVLPEAAARAVLALPFAAPVIGDTFGKRETNNATRNFFGQANRARFAVCEDLARAFQAQATVAALRAASGAALPDVSLRIEYCQDTDGFWLEPHTDIGAKRFTMLIYLSDTPRAESWGTDIYDADKRHLGAVPGGFNKGLIFVPGADTWHGVERRRFSGIRRSLIINYVGPEWRARQELAFPDAPIV